MGTVRNMPLRGFFLIVCSLALAACAGGPLPTRHGTQGIAGLEAGTKQHPALGTPIGYVRGKAADSAGDAAAARPVLYLHGAPGSKEDWADYLVQPVPGTFSIAIDRPGYGASAASGPVSDLMAQAQALEPFLPMKGQKPAIVVGFSTGGAAAMAAAMLYPDQVAAVVAVATPMDPEGPLPLVGDGALGWLAPKRTDVSGRELAPLRGELSRLTGYYYILTQPVVILHGTEDALVPYANVAYMERNLGWSRKIDSVTLIGADHYLPWKAEAELRRAIQKAVTFADAAKD